MISPHRDLPRRVAELLLRFREAGRPVVELGLTPHPHLGRVRKLARCVSSIGEPGAERFERRGWILTEGQTITIMQLDRLRRLADE